jgi:hypothetical protein
MILFLATIFLAIATKFISLKSFINIKLALLIYIAFSFIIIGQRAVALISFPCSRLEYYNKTLYSYIRFYNILSRFNPFYLDSYNFNLPKGLLKIF